MNIAIYGIIWTALSFWFMGLLNGKSRIVAYRLGFSRNPGLTSIFLLIIGLPAYAICTIYNFVISLNTLKNNIKDEVKTKGNVSIYSVLSIATIGIMSFVGYEVIAWIMKINDFIDTGKLH